MGRQAADDRRTLGASGATFEFYRHSVRKEDKKNPALMTAQSRFMAEVGTDVFPKVWYEPRETIKPNVFQMDDAYSMERLEDLHFEDPVAFRSGIMIDAMHALLRRLWGFPTGASTLGQLLLTDAHLNYMAGKFGTRQRRMDLWLGSISQVPVTVVERVHGDPTLENVMMRGEDFVFIDPIPATDKLPAFVALDLGKMLQSTWGYERLKGNDVCFMGDVLAISKLVTNPFPDGDRLASHYLLCVHIARLIPYQPANIQHVFWDMLDAAIEAYAI